MTDKGYLASLETTTEWLKKCDYEITYLIDGEKEQTDYVKEKDLEWFMNHYESKDYEILAVAKIDKSKINELAKTITEKLAKRIYKYVH